MAKRTIHVRGGTLIWDDGEIGVMLRGEHGEVGQDTQRRAYAVQKRMKRLAPKDTGELEAGIRVESVGKSPTGPVSRVISDAPHTIVAEVGRRAVRASGLPGGGVRTRGSGVSLSKSSLTWGSDNSSSPMRLKFRDKTGEFIYPREAGPAAGSRFMERSVDAAVD